MWQAREVFAAVLRPPLGVDLQMNLVYDVAHNIAKMEEHAVDGRRRDGSACIARGRRGRFPPGHPEVPGSVPRRSASR